MYAGVLQYPKHQHSGHSCFLNGSICHGEWKLTETEVIASSGLLFTVNLDSMKQD